MFLLTLATTTAAPQTQLDELIARAKSLELDTPYVPPPGDPLAHHAAGYAKVMCSAVFITGLAPDFAAENVGFFTAPHEIRAILGKPVIDRANQVVHVTLPNGPTRTQISQLQRKWLWVADIFQFTVDMAFEQRITLRRGSSISKAIDLC